MRKTENCSSRGSFTLPRNLRLIKKLDIFSKNQAVRLQSEKDHKHNATSEGSYAC